MSTSIERRVMAELRHEVDAIRGNWIWFLVLGLALIVLGAVMLGYVVIASLAATMALGVMILLGGVFECVGAFWSRAWSGFFLHLLCGVLGVVVGLMMMRAPAQGAAALTLLLASFLMVSGAFEIVAALTYRLASWGWVLFSGVIDLLLGLMIWMEWPASSLWVIGLFVGISLIFRGVNWVMIALAFKSLPRLTDIPTAP